MDRVFLKRDIFDKLLVYYGNLVDQEKTNEDINLMQEVFERLDNSIAIVSFEKFQLNKLETRLKVLDFDQDHINASTTNRKIPVIFLSDKIKSLFNYFVPMVKDRRACIQLTSYKILRKIMREISLFYEIKPIFKVIIFYKLR